MLKTIESFLAPTGVLLFTAALLFINAWLFKRLKSATYDGNVAKMTIGVFVVLIGLVAFILTMPINPDHKGQILGIIGIVLSAGIALSSTTVLGNMIAGFTNDAMNRFRNGEVVVMVSHADFKRRLLHELIAGDTNPESLGKLRNTGITKLDWNGESWQLDWFNSASHLPARLITGNE